MQANLEIGRVGDGPRNAGSPLDGVDLTDLQLRCLGDGYAKK